MTGDDRPGIVEILRNTPEFTPDEVEVARELIDIYLQQGTRSGYHVLVAETDSSPVGYICYGPTPLTRGTWDIYWMAVAPAQQGRGIGRVLLTAAEDEIKSAAGRLILIETSSKIDYERARGFYRKQGYRVAETITDFYSPGDDRVVFRKDLA